MIPELTSKLSRMVPVTLLAISLAASGCSSTPSPPAGNASASPAVAQSGGTGPKSLPPMKEDEKAVVDRLVADWRFTTDHVKIPPLSSLNWRPLKAGVELPAPSILITDKASTVTLQADLSQFVPSFVDFVKSGQVVGYQVAGDRMEIQVLPETIYPVRPGAGITKPGVRTNLVVAKVQGKAIYSPDSQNIDKNYSALQPHFTVYPSKYEKKSPGPAPSLAAASVHLKRGLGIRGRDVKPMTDVVERLKPALETGDGVYIDAVFPNSPADGASGTGGKLRPGDVILHINETAIHSRDDLKKALDTVPADGKVTVEFVRLVRPKNADQMTQEEVDKLSTPQKFNSSLTLAEVTGDANYIPPPDAAPSAAVSPAAALSPAAGGTATPSATASTTP